MANQEQLDLLKQGSDVWNTWRKQHPSLRHAHLVAANLCRADLSVPILREAFFIKAHLSRANLNRAHLLIS